MAKKVFSITEIKRRLILRYMRQDDVDAVQAAIAADAEIERMKKALQN